MRSIKATKRYFLKKEWIDGDICKLIALIFVTLFAVAALKYLSAPPTQRTIEKRIYLECNGGNINEDICTEIINAKPAISSDKVGRATNQKNTHANNYKPNDFIKDGRDVAAQEGMWRATNFVAIATFGQIVLGVFGLALIYGTMVETRKVLIEAKKTTEAAMEATRVARQANINELKPYLSIKFVEPVIFGNDFLDRGTLRVGFKLNIFNAGKTPASNIFVEFDPSKSSFSLFDHNQKGSSSAGFSGIAESEPLLSKEVISFLHENREGFGFSIGGDFRTAHEDWKKYCELFGRFYAAEKWSFIGVKLGGISIRYKDLECEGQDWHKLALAVAHYPDHSDDFAQLTTRIIRVARCNDKENKEYEKYLSLEPEKK